MLKYKGISDSFRLEILEDYLFGSLSKMGIERKYNLSHGCILRWLRIFGFSDKISIEAMAAKDHEVKAVPPAEDVTSLELRIKQLESALKEAEMARDAYDCLLDLAESKYHIRIRKNSDAK